MHCYISFSIIGKLVGVVGGSGFLHCLVGWLGVTAVRCYGRVFFPRCIRRPLQVYGCGGGVRLWCWYVRRASGFCGVIEMFLIKIKDYGKTRMRGRKKIILNVIRICVCMCIYLYMCGSNEANVLTFSVVHTYQHHKRTPPPQQYTCSGHRVHLRMNTRP